MADSDSPEQPLTPFIRNRPSYRRTRREALPQVQPPTSRPQLPDFSSIMTDATTEAEPVDHTRLEEKLKQFEEEEMERRERYALELEQQQKEGGINVPGSLCSNFKDKRKKNLIFDEERFEDTFLKCLICREAFDADTKMPKMLPCHHTFCMDCLCQMWRVEGEFRQTLTSAFRGMPMAVKINCPTCRDGLITSEAEVKRLPNDHTILELLTFMKDTKRSDVQYCSKHQMQPLNFFCEPCVVPVCSDCTVLDHKESKGHIVVNVNEALDKYAPILETTMEEIRTQKTKLDENKESLIKAAEKLDNIQKDVNTKIKNVFEQLREALDDRERELYDMTEREVGRKRGLLETGLKTVISRDESLKAQMNSLTTAKEEKDISCMFTGHKRAREVLAEKVELCEDSTESFSVEFCCDNANESSIRQDISNLADIVFSE